MLPKNIEKVLISEDEIRDRCRQLGAEITAQYGEEPIHCICILKGAYPFAADLLREIKSPVSIDFMAVSSYGASTKSSGTVRIVKDLTKDLAGLHALILEDIVDTGLTLNFLLGHLQSHNPKSLRVASLLSKPSTRKIEVPIDFCGFEVPDEFVVGYGLDYAEFYRNLPFVGVLKPEAYGG